MPAIAVLLVVGTLVYIATADLDTIEARALAPDVILEKAYQHVLLVVISTVTVVAIGVPVGILLSRPWAKYFRAPVLAIANAGQAIPSIGILVLLALLFGVGFNMAVIALVIYALLPILRNTIIGLQQVSPFIIDAAKGMGMNARRILFTVEVPLAVPVMLAGIRVSLILNVGVATLATYTNAGGLGDLIERGIVFYRMPILLTGCLLTIALALLVDSLAGFIENRLRPKGV
ncbi:osmoprotectant transport system permease protein [Pseudarthrobacter sp. W1I19]|uniref:ABC transporter permease n=1 Tax=Pseudarthrobacter sp. W1I19 TaxID=3042288 RepID=UPI00277F5A5E|nr:ABC transporter permease [Pseudarthrobacter sp. W1I19]MDQ0923892.1 osmoprotectant transport system permease protein [Pseudarthrobacter sp. W1I19]